MIKPKRLLAVLLIALLTLSMMPVSYTVAAEDNSSTITENYTVNVEQQSMENAVDEETANDETADAIVDDEEGPQLLESQSGADETISEDRDLKGESDTEEASDSSDAATTVSDDEIDSPKTVESDTGSAESEPQSDEDETVPEESMAEPVEDSADEEAVLLKQQHPDLLLTDTGGVDASEHFHATITTNRDTYTSGETAQVSIKYTIDQNTISPGDYVVVTIPPDISSKASFSVSSQHFSTVEDLGNGQYKLVFGENAATGLSGSMTIRVTTSADEETTGTITAGDGEKAITVIPAGSGETGVGVFADEAIMKDGLGNEGMDYGGYDYSQDEAAQIGLFDSSVDHDFTYRLFINRKNVTMTNVTVTDNLPDGMYFNGQSTVICYKIDASTMSRTNEVLSGASVSISGQTLTVYLGDIDYPVEIEYSVHVPAQTSVHLRNHSEVTYTQDGTTYKEHRDYIAQGNDYSASNGVKCVDKTIISDDPSDQWVTYTIKFWNENSFAAGEITLTDDLDDHVRFLYSDDNEYFELTVDENDPTILHITNVKDIPASTEVYETFVCDFSGVPIGYTVLNTTGGNTTTTTKISGSAALTARKTVDGTTPSAGEVFNIRLMDQNRRVLQTVSSDESGNVVFDYIKYGKDDLGKTYTYYIAEVIPAGDDSYIYDEAEYTVTVTVGSEADDEGVIPVSVVLTKDGNAVTEAAFNNEKPVVEKTSVSGSKTWDDANNQDGKRPESITVNLYADGTKAASKTVTAEDDWKWTFDDLDKYADGKLITYSIDEDPVAEYQSEVSGYDVINTYTPGKVSIPVRKAWEDNEDQDGTRPDDITVRLLADNVDTGKTLTLSAGNNWKASFDDLDEYADGKKILYSVEEITVTGYTTETAGDADTGFVITNTHTPEKTSVSGSKTWDDVDDQDGKRPVSITINLYADGIKIDSKAVTAEDDWKWSFDNLDKYATGKLITYTIDESPIEEYQSDVIGYDVTNTYTPGKVSVPVRKAWEDNDDQDGIRPEEVVIILLADGKETGKSLTLNSENGWADSFADLDEYADGKKIDYSVKEEEIADYSISIDGNIATGYVVTNTHTPEKINISGNKTWDDADDQDGKRPESIKINLYADGTKVDSKTVTAEDDWKWSFDDLDKYADGKLITYSIDEDPVAEYQSEVIGYNISNTYTPGKISIPVRKVWEDSDDQDGIRPADITVTLYADGQITDQKLVLSSQNQWKNIFSNLDEYKDGNKITYTIGENEVSGYNCVITGSAETGFFVTNSHTPEDKPKPDQPEKSDKAEKPDQPSKPSNPGNPSIPKTGDESHIYLWLGLMLASLIALLYLGYVQLKNLK